MGSPQVLFKVDDEVNTSAIAVGDVTGSGQDELCTGGRDGLIRLYDAKNGSTELLAQKDITGAILSLKIADANNDGLMEIVVGRSVGPDESPGTAGTLQIYRYSPSGTLDLLAESNIDAFVTTVVVTDVTGDNKNEIMAGGSDSTVRVYKMNTDNNLTETILHKLDDMPISIGTCDVIGDEIDEIIIGNRDKTLRVYKVRDRTLEETEVIELPSPIISIADGDILGDRKMELGVVTHDGSIRIYRNEESRLHLFSKLENVSALSIRIEELNADHLDEIVVAGKDFKIRFYKLDQGELTEIGMVDIGSKILSICVGDVAADYRKEVLVGVSEGPLYIIEGLYQLLPVFDVKKQEEGKVIQGSLTVVNVTDAPINGISGKIYHFPKDNLVVEPQQIKMDLGPKESKTVNVNLMPKVEGSVIIRPIVLMWADEDGQVKQVTTPETALLVDEGFVDAVPADVAPVKVSSEAAFEEEAVGEATGFGAVREHAGEGIKIETSSGTTESLKAAEDLLDQLFGEKTSAPAEEIVDTVEETVAEVVSPEHAETVEPEPAITPEVPTTVEEIEPVEVESDKVTFIKNRPPKPPRPGADTDEYSYLFKVMIIGEGAVGKTALVNRYTTGSFSTDYKTTIGSQFAVKLTHIFPQEPEFAVGIKIQVWDVAGQARFKGVRKMYYSGAAGCIVVFDVTRRRTFTELERWIQEADDAVGARVPMIVVGNKIDLPDRAVSSDEAKTWAENNGFLYMESSAKTGENVGDMFTVLSELMWDEARIQADAKKRAQK